MPIETDDSARAALLLALADCALLQPEKPCLDETGVVAAKQAYPVPFADTSCCGQTRCEPLGAAQQGPVADRAPMLVDHRGLVRVARLCPEPGVNLSLADSLRLAHSRGTRE